MFEASERPTTPTGAGRGATVLGGGLVVVFLLALAGFGVWSWHRSQASRPSHIASSDIVACRLFTQPQAEHVLGGPLEFPPTAPTGTTYISGFGGFGPYGSTGARTGSAKSVPDDDGCTYVRTLGNQLLAVYIDIVPKEDADTASPSASASPGAAPVHVRKLPRLGLTGEERSAADPELGQVHGVTTTNTYWSVEVLSNASENGTIEVVRDLLATPQLQQPPGPRTGGTRF